MAKKNCGERIDAGYVPSGRGSPPDIESLRAGAMTDNLAMRTGTEACIYRYNPQTLKSFDITSTEINWTVIYIGD
jgi:hypothetical protein